MTVSLKQVQDDLTVSLIEAYRERGDRRALERLLALYGKLLSHIVHRHMNAAGEPYEDLLQVGYVGLMKAVKGYRIGSEAKFSSYAYSMISGELRHHLRDTVELVRRPRWAKSLYYRITEATAKLSTELGRPPLVEEIAREVNITAEGVNELMKLFHNSAVTSLESSQFEEDKDIDFGAIRSQQYESFVLPIEDRILLQQALESLTEVQRKVVYLFFYKDLSQTEIGRRLGIPQRKVSRIVASATKSLKASLKATWHS